MTAIRIIDDHNGLQNVGTLTHEEIDTFVSGSTFVIVSGTLPPQGRRLVAGSGVSFVDDPIGGTLTVTASGSAGAAQITWNEMLTPGADGTLNAFSLSQVPTPTSALMLFVNGQFQTQGSDNDYVLSGTLVTLAYTPRSGSNIIATYPY